jgi:hypothetical protein
MNALRKRQVRGKKGLLPILIRYRAQDYETRYLDDPRVLYIEEYHDLHRNDGFVAMIPSEKMNRLSRRMRWALAVIGVILAGLLLAARPRNGRYRGRIESNPRTPRSGETRHQTRPTACA